MTHSMAHIGVLPAGARNSITDVAGITVGHATLAGGSIQTGVTVVRPHAGDPFLDKVPTRARCSTASARASACCRWRSSACWRRPSR